MINAILKGIFSIILNLVSVLLIPIDLIIESVLPDLASAFNAIANLFNYIATGLGWVVSVFGLPSECLSLIVLYYTFKLTSPLLVSTIKSALNWYNKLKI